MPPLRNRRAPIRLTADEYLRSKIEGPSELVRGQLRMMTPASGGHGAISGRIFAAVYAFVEQHSLGVCFPDNTGFLLPGIEDTVRSPDAAYLARARVPSEGLGADWIIAAPNLVVEVVSPTETRLDLEEKVRDYFTAGTEAIWIVDPVSREVRVRLPREPERCIQLGEMLLGDPVLPGFRLPVDSLFAGLTPPRQA